MKKSFTEELEKALFNVMMSNSNGELSDLLWSIEFHEGGKVFKHGNDIIIKGDNGIANLTRILIEEL